MTRSFPSSRARVSVLAFVLFTGACSAPRAGSEPRDPVPYNRTATGSGLIIEDLVIGHGPICTSDRQIIVVEYIARDPEGRIVDSTEDSGATAFVLADAMRGWRQGMIGMRRGGTRRLTIPPHLGQAREDGSPSETLTFDITLLDVRRP